MCIHDLGSCISVYNHKTKSLQGYIVCDQCGERIHTGYSQSYEPKPVMINDPLSLFNRYAL